VWADGAKDFVSINTETITQICGTDIKTNFTKITDRTAFILSPCAVEIAVTPYALSHHATMHN
jgi:hypothetical protein